MLRLSTARRDSRANTSQSKHPMFSVSWTKHKELSE